MTQIDADGITKNSGPLSALSAGKLGGEQSCTVHPGTSNATGFGYSLFKLQ